MLRAAVRRAVDVIDKVIVVPVDVAQAVERDLVALEKGLPAFRNDEIQNGGEPVRRDGLFLQRLIVDGLPVRRHKELQKIDGKFILRGVAPVIHHGEITAVAAHVPHEIRRDVFFFMRAGHRGVIEEIDFEIIVFQPEREAEAGIVQ